MSEMQRCATCLYLGYTDVHRAVCRRYPPTMLMVTAPGLDCGVVADRLAQRPVMKAQVVVGWPTLDTLETNYCGEYTLRPPLPVEE